MATQISGPSLVKGVSPTRSTIFLKLLMATTGVIFILFVLLHMYGNLMAFGGELRFNSYAEHLRTVGEPMLPYAGLLWVIRAVLIVSVVLHVWSAAKLWRRANEARRHKYAMKKNLGSSLSSRTMRWGGIAILLFLIWHLINFTIGKVNVTGGATNNPYHLVYDSFSTWWLTLIYLAAMVALGFHLHHGTWSAAQTLGLTTTARSRRIAKSAGWVVAIVIAGGFCLVPLGVLFDIVPSPGI